jgi:branched-chain amino acid transport system ATP-binding protein
VTPALQLDHVSIRFGGVQAVADVSLSVSAGDFVGLIGPNGAGKTTLIRIIVGILRPDEGKVQLAGRDIKHLATAERVRHGLAFTHQIVKPFRTMTVLDNVVLAAGYRRTASPLRALLQVGREKEKERALTIIAKVGLAGTERKLAGTLPLGQLKRLELARALAVNPTVVLLDEPLAGLDESEAIQQVDTIAEVNAAGTTVVLVEHNLEQVTRISRRLVVLSGGRIIADGEPREVMANAVVREAYLGDGERAHAKD